MTKFDENTQAIYNLGGVGGGGNINIYLNDAPVGAPQQAVQMITEAVTMIRRSGYRGRGA
jgi:hypothetical protein